MPVLAWKQTLVSTVVGAITGLMVAALLQQAGRTPLALATAMWGIIIGGGVTFGVGLTLAAVRTYVRAPLDEEASGRRNSG